MADIQFTITCPDCFGTGISHYTNPPDGESDNGTPCTECEGTGRRKITQGIDATVFNEMLVILKDIQDKVTKNKI